MLTVEDIRKKADTPYAKGYPELERLYQTLPELFSKNAFAPIFKSSEKFAHNEQSGDAVQQEPGKKPRGQQYIDMRMDDYTETLNKPQGRHQAAGVNRSTLENHFMDEGMRTQTVPAKGKQPQTADFPIYHEMGPKQEQVYNKLKADDAMFASPHSIPTHEMYMLQPGMFPENYEEDYDQYNGEMGDPYHQMHHYGHPMPGIGGYNQEGQFVQGGYPPYYYPPHAGEQIMSHGYVLPTAPAQHPKPRKQQAQGAVAAKRSEDEEEKPNSKEGGMEHANYIKNTGVIDDMEMDPAQQYYPPDHPQGYPPQEYEHPYNYGYMNYVNQAEGEEDIQGGVHMMHQQYGYYGKDHDPHYSNAYMGYEDPYMGYDMHNQNMAYDPQQYMHPEYDMPYGQQGYHAGFYGEHIEEHPMQQFDSRQGKGANNKAKKNPNPKEGGGSNQNKPQGQKKTQEKSQKGQGPTNNGKPQKKQQQHPLGVQAGTFNPNDINQYQQPQYRQPVNTHQMGHQIPQSNQMRGPAGGKPNGDQIQGQPANRGKQGQPKSNSNLANLEQPGQNPKKASQKPMDGNQRKGNQNNMGQNNMGMMAAPGQRSDPMMMQGKAGGSFNHIQSPQMNMGQQPMSGELGTPGQKKRKSQQQAQPDDSEFVDDYYEEGGNGLGPSSSQKSANRARQVFFVKK